MTKERGWAHRPESQKWLRQGHGRRPGEEAIQRRRRKKKRRESFIHTRVGNPVSKKKGQLRQKKEKCG